MNYLRIINAFTRARDFLRRKLPKKVLLPILLLVLSAAAFADFFTSGLVRRSFVFFDIDSGIASVENRMLARSTSRERDLTRYVEEALLGPISPNSLPLFPRGTRLRSLLYRDGTVYADLSEEAVLPPAEGGEVRENMRTLLLGIKRNFPFVDDVRFFITGRAVFRDELN